MTTPTGSPRPRAEVVVDLDAVAANVRTLRQRVAPAGLMVVVKADGYGHGMLEVARTARSEGAEWLGVATLDEALALRAAGDTGRVLCWLTVPGDELVAGVDAEVDLTAYSVAEVDEVRAAARAVGRPARLQLKVDTGLGRGGAAEADWPAVVGAARAAERAGELRVTGVWSHFACSDEPGHPANEQQEKAFDAAVRVVADAGLTPELRHLANSAAALTRPEARLDLVRCGLAAYGLSPVPQLHTAAELGLVPAMTARASVALAKRVPAGFGVSYGHTYVTEQQTTLAVVPVGYADGVLRSASSRARVLVAGHRHPVAGRVCMDQFVVDVGDHPVAAGDEVVLFGPGLDGEPTAQDWADACGTISYEIVTRVGGRFHRRHTGAGAGR